MKVGELIEELRKQKQDAMAIVSGYEGGYDEVDCVEKQPLKLNQHKEWYYGKHESCEEEKADVIAVVIS